MIWNPAGDPIFPLHPPEYTQGVAIGPRALVRCDVTPAETNISGILVLLPFPDVIYPNFQARDIGRYERPGYVGIIVDTWAVIPYIWGLREGRMYLAK